MVVDRKGVRVMDWFRVWVRLRVRVTARLRDWGRVRAGEDKAKMLRQRHKTKIKTKG